MLKYVSWSKQNPPNLSECLNKSVQSVRNKFSHDNFSVSDLIKIRNVLDCELSIRTHDAQTMYLGMEDLKDAGNKTKDTETEKTDSLTDMDKLVIDAVLNPSVPPEGTRIVTEEDVREGRYTLEEGWRNQDTKSNAQTIPSTRE